MDRLDELNHSLDWHLATVRLNAGDGPERLIRLDSLKAIRRINHQIKKERSR